MISKFLFFGIGLKIKKFSILGSTNFQMHMDLLFHHYFNFLSAKTEISKNKISLIHFDELEALKKQFLGT